MTSVLRTPDTRFDNLPGWSFAPRYLDDLPGYAGLRMHYVDAAPRSQPNPDAPVFLCLHGQPTWAYLYRRMIPVLTAAGYRVVAPDLFGFGRSDKPADEATYTFDFHRNALLALIDRLDLRNICLVVQDWGGILGLTLPISAPERYTRLLVMNTALPTGEEAPPGFAAWRAFNRTKPDLGVGALMQRGAAHLSEAEAAAYDAPFPDASFKAGVRRFPELVMWRDPGEALSDAAGGGIAHARAARDFWSSTWEGRSFMAIGMQDPVLGPPVMSELRQCIRGCPAPMEVADAGHFVQEWGAPIAEAALAAFDL
ncbi:MAG: haloalkane dehalogenase [Pseudomonadota bacterium]